MERQWNNDRNENRLQSFLKVTQYRGGIHGLSHAKRVEKFGLMLAEKTDADRDVIIWFAYLHDSQRTNDGFDNNHGPDAARFVDTIRNTFLQELNDTQILQLKEACRLHTSTHRTGDITIDTCFDADRLDLPRVGNMPDPKRMATEQGAKYAGVSYKNNCFTIGCDGAVGLQFHNKIIKTGNGKSKFAVRYNKITDNNKSISPYAHSGWDLYAKSVSEIAEIEGFKDLDSVGTGIYAVEFDTFVSGKGYAAKEMIKNKNTTLILLEYTDDDVIENSDIEICLRQCNIVYVSEQQTFISAYKDGTLNKLMSQFAAEKEAASYNTYIKPKRNINPLLRILANDFNSCRPTISIRNVNLINWVEDLLMPRAVVVYGALITIANLEKEMCVSVLNCDDTLYDEEKEMLLSIFGMYAGNDVLTEKRRKAFEDASVIDKYIFTGKDASGVLFYKSSKYIFEYFVKSLRKKAEEKAKIIYNTNFKIITPSK